METKDIAKVKRAMELAREVIRRWSEYVKNGRNEADLALVYFTADHFFRSLMEFDERELEGKIKPGRFDPDVDWLDISALTEEQLASIPVSLPFALIQKYKLDLRYTRVNSFKVYVEKFYPYIEMVN